MKLINSEIWTLKNWGNCLKKGQKILETQKIYNLEEIGKFLEADDGFHKTGQISKIFDFLKIG